MNLVSSLQSTCDFQNNKTLQGGLIFICGLCQLMTASLLEIEDSYSGLGCNQIDRSLYFLISL